MLLSQAARLGLNGEQVFVGTHGREGLRRAMLHHTDIFVLPSLSREGLPLALVEAMACGLPIVATTVGGIPEVVEDGVNGLLCPPGDSVCLARKLLSLVEDPEERIRLGRSARRSFERGPFQPDSVCRRLVSIYEETLTTARNSRD
jgi:glycosyltransferase involved in cell wall biosynthesis